MKPVPVAALAMDGPRNVREEEPRSAHLLHITWVAPQKHCLDHLQQEGADSQKENHFILVCLSLRNSGMLDSQCRIAK